MDINIDDTAHGISWLAQIVKLLYDWYVSSFPCRTFSVFYELNSTPFEALNDFEVFFSNWVLAICSVSIGFECWLMQQPYFLAISSIKSIYYSLPSLSTQCVIHRHIFSTLVWETHIADITYMRKIAAHLACMHANISLGRKKWKKEEY